jgi:hypothetical protein
VLDKVRPKPPLNHKDTEYEETECEESGRELTGRELITKGRATLDKKASVIGDFLAQGMSKAQWQAVKPASLKLRDPCSTCQVLFGGRVHFLHACALEPEDRLGDNWSRIRGH